ncbi:alpha/beta fold hydrolase [Ornithinimicrobium sp. LYQ92]|uniref:alpha/beta fold hydrolase n=1 Tax=Serinicoccus sp. LYQ92 TaxID=3378798 RepID=UPI0038545A69
MQWRSVVEFGHAGTTAHVRRLGPDSGPQYVLVHGIGVGHSYFTRLAAALTGTGAKAAGPGGVHVLELPGFGGTPRPPAPLTIEQLAGVVVAYIRHTGLDRPVLVGHSMGAQVVLEAVLQDPAVAGSVVSIGGVVDPVARSVARQGLRLVADLLLETPSANWVVLRDYARTGPRRYLETVPIMLGYPTDEALARLPVPLLVIRGSRDPVAPQAWAEHMARLAPVGRLVEIPGAHVVMHTRPEEVAREIATHSGVGREAVGQ